MVDGLNIIFCPTQSALTLDFPLLSLALDTVSFCLKQWARAQKLQKGRMHSSRRAGLAVDGTIGKTQLLSEDYSILI